MDNRLNILRNWLIKRQISNENITQSSIEKQSEICNDIFVNWKGCIRAKSWNDKDCLDNYKSEYDLCLNKLNLMKASLDRDSTYTEDDV